MTALLHVSSDPTRNMAPGGDVEQAGPSGSALATGNNKQAPDSDEIRADVDIIEHKVEGEYLRWAIDPTLD